MSNATQFLPGQIKSIQRGTIAISSGTSNTATVTSVDTSKSILMHLGQSSTQTGIDNVSTALALTNATTITATRGGSTGTTTVGYQLIEYT